MIARSFWALAALWAGCVHAAGGCGVPLPPLPERPSQARQVTEFGAWPDDEAADDDAIERALAALQPGDWLVFPPGRYLQRRSLYVRTSNITLDGRGAELKALDPADQTLGVRASGVRIIGFRLSAATDQRATTIESTRVSALPDAPAQEPLRNVLIRGNTITSGASAGLYISGASAFTVAENEVSGTLADGIHITGASTWGRVAYNRVHGTGDDAIAVVSYGNDGRPVTEVLIEHNSVDDLPWGRGIAVVGGDGITVRGNRVQGVARAAGILVAREDGWQTQASQRVLIEDNGVYAVQAPGPVTGHAALEVHALGTDILPGVDDLVLRGNVIAQGGTDGIRIGADSVTGSVTHLRLIGNRLLSQQGHPISMLVGGAIGIPANDRGEGAQLDCMTLPR